MEIGFPKFRFPIIYKKDDGPNYKVIELQAENEKLKDELIESLREQVLDLRMQLERYTARVYTKGQIVDEEKDVGSHMIVSSARPRVRTMSEVATLLEKRSLNAVSLKEEPKENDKV